MRTSDLKTDGTLYLVVLPYEGGTHRASIETRLALGDRTGDLPYGGHGDRTRTVRVRFADDARARLAGQTMRVRPVDVYREAAAQTVLSPTGVRLKRIDELRAAVDEEHSVVRRLAREADEVQATAVHMRLLEAMDCLERARNAAEAKYSDLTAQQRREGATD